MRPEISSVVGKKISKKEFVLRAAASLAVLGSTITGGPQYKKAEARTLSLEIEPVSINFFDEPNPQHILGPQKPDQEQTILEAEREFTIGLENARIEQEQIAAEEERKKHEEEQAKAQKAMTVSPPVSAPVTAQAASLGVPSGKLIEETESPTVWQILADCETGDGEVGAPYYVTWNSNGSFEGAFQFLNSTWRSLNSAAGYEHAYQAPPEIQLQAAQELQARGGWGQWPSCTERMIDKGYIK